MAFPYDQAPAQNLIDGQLTPNEITSEPLLAVIRTTPRERFVPEAFAQAAYVDEEIPLGEGRYLIAPLVQAKLLQALDAQPQESILVIGGATGYTAALLSHFAARVELVEEDPRIAHMAQQALQSLGVANVKVVQHPLAHGAPGAGPYDAILVEGAVQVLPDAIAAQLKEGGRLLVCENKQLRPGGHVGLAQAKYYEKREGRLSARVLFDAGISLLPGFEAPPTFSFN